MNDDKDLNARKIAGEKIGDYESGKIRMTPIQGFAKPLSEIYTLKQLEIDKQKQLLSIAKLPYWIDKAEEKESHVFSKIGYGWGSKLNGAIGGGLCPGEILAVGASHAGAGKTAFLMQLVDGLALRNIEPQKILTPILLLSEMNPKSLIWRSLGRWTGKDSRNFRRGIYDEHGKVVRAQTQLFLEAGQVFNGRYGQSRKWIWFMDAQAFDGNFANLADPLNAWKSCLLEEHSSKGVEDVWPILVIDPIQRWQNHEKHEVEALNELCESINNLAHKNGWIVLMTSDTTKGSSVDGSSGNSNKVIPNVFRGSYKLMHILDFALVLGKRSGAEERVISAALVKNRSGSTAKYWESTQAVFDYEWTPRNGRFRCYSESRQCTNIPVTSRG